MKRPNWLETLFPPNAERSLPWPAVLLDYETNTDVWNTAKPLSGLVRAYLLGEWPDMKELK